MIKVVVIEVFGQRVVQRPGDAIELVTSLVQTFEQVFNGVVERVILTVEYMNQNDFDNLPEFTGFRPLVSPPKNHVFLTLSSLNPGKYR